MGLSRLHSSVRTRILVVVGAVVVVTVLLVTMLGARSFEQHYTAALQAQGTAVGRILASQLEQLLRLGIPAEELVGFDQQCQDAVDSYDDVVYAMVLSDNGDVLFKDNHVEIAATVEDRLLLEAVASGREHVLHELEGKVSTLDVLVPVSSHQGSHVIAVRIGINHDAITLKTSLIIRNSAITGLIAVMVAVMFLMFFLGRAIIRPLSQIDRAMGNIALDTAERISLSSNDEFGTIARTYNHMLDALSQSREELKAYTAELESKVAERTAELTVVNERLSQDIEVRKQTEERLEVLVYTDTLTGLPNRDYVTQLIDRKSRTDDPFAVVFVDVDRFKYVNDTFGHAAGDELLIEIASRLTGVTRNSDVVARLGGDEFVFVLDGIDIQETANAVADKIIAQLSRPILLNDLELIVTSSLGIALYPVHGDNGEALLQHADSAMYRAKSLGRNRAAVYTPDLTEESEIRLTLESELRQALDNGGLTIHYQPRICLASHRIASVEALIRWPHPKLGMIPPDQFLPIANETDLIVDIGNWVMQEACAALVRIDEHCKSRIGLSVNVAERQVKTGSLPSLVASALSTSGLTPERLEIELVEQCVMIDDFVAKNTFASLRQMRVKLAIDDFGAGYSSLNRLKQVPFDTLKMDGVFIRDLDQPEHEADRAVVETILTLGRKLGISVVAECIERAEQAHYLSDLGCDQGQGFHFARPLTEQQLVEYLQSVETSDVHGKETSAEHHATTAYRQSTL